MADESGSLNQVNLFADLDEREVEEIFAISDLMKLDALSEIFRQGSAGDALYILMSGAVELRHCPPDSNKSRIIADISPGGYFGEISIIDDHPRSLSAATLEPSVLLKLPKEPVLKLLAENSSIALKFYRAFTIVLCNRLRTATDELASRLRS